MGYGKTYKTKWLEDLSGNQGTANQVLISTSAGIAWAAASTIIGGPYLPLSGGTMTGNTTHGDNVRSLYGASSDLQVYHDGSNSYVRDVGTGRLWIDSNGEGVSIISDGSGSTPMAHFYKDGAVELYHNNVRRFRTNDIGGVSVSHTSGSLGNSFFGAVSGASNGFQIANTSSNEITYTFQNGSNSQVLKILNNGNVGIGTTSPIHKLHVAGNARVTGAYYDSTNSPGTGGQVLTSTATGTDWIDPTLLPAESAEKVIQSVRMGEAVSKGDPLVITGYHGSNGPVIVERANATNATKMPAYGVALENYANNATGLMIAVGDFDDFDTSGYSVGDTLYVAVGGGMTKVKPTGTGLIQNMGVVSRSNANNGQVEIVAIGRTNDVPNLPVGRLFVGTSGNTSLTSDVVYIDDTNDRVGIGTTSPSEKLEVNGNIQISDSDGYLQFNDTNAASGNRIRRIYNGEQNLYFSRRNDDGTLEANDMTITSSGNVGIGTTSPVGKFEVQTEDSNRYIRFKAPNGEERFEFYTGGTGNPSSLGMYTSDGTTKNVQISSGGSTYFNGGNVGIGTTSPTFPLDVVGDGIKLTRNSKTFIFNADFASAGTHANIQCDAGMGLSFSTNASEKMRILGGGNVGIGTTSPTEKLEVDGIIKAVHTDDSYATYRGNGVFFNRSDSYLAPLTDNTSTLNVGYNGGRWGNLEINAAFVKFENGPNEFMRITSAGNVGIGTTAPEAKLTIKGDALTTDQPVRITNSVTDTHTGLFLNNTGSTVGEKYGMQFGGYNQYSIGGIFGVLDSVSGNTSGDITFDLGNGTASGALVERMRITHEGNVGIGTITPEGNLHVVGATGGQGRIYVSDKDNGESPTDSLLITQSATNSFIYNRDSGDLSLGSNNQSSMMTIKSSGNVGIGTTAPDAILHVKGSTNSTEVKIDTNDNALGDNAFIKFNGARAQVGWIGAAVTLTDGGGNKDIKLKVGTGSIFLQTNNTSRLTVASGGNVGIGTTSPSEKLTVSGGANVTGKFAVGNTSTHPSFDFYNQGTAYFNGSTTVDDNLLVTNGSVGIGTTTPSFKLDTRGSVRIKNTDENTLYLDTESAGQQVGIFYRENGASKWEQRVGSNFELYNYARASWDFHIQGSTGNVGIGTTSPAASALLDVASTSKGVLLPRMSTTQINAISSPAEGLTVYNTVLSTLCFFNGISWQKVTSTAM